MIIIICFFSCRMLLLLSFTFLVVKTVCTFHLWSILCIKRSPTSPVPDERALSPLDNMNDLTMEAMNHLKHGAHDMTDYALKHENDNHLATRTVTGSKSHTDLNDPGRDNFETTFDLDGNVETKSVGSAKSAGSNQEIR